MLNQKEFMNKIQARINELLADELKEDGYGSGEPLDETELGEYLDDNIIVHIQQPDRGSIGNAEAVSEISGHCFQFKYVQYMYRIEVYWDTVEEVEPYQEMVTVTKYKPIKNIMKIEKFDPEIHTRETHWSYRLSDSSEEQYMLRINRFFGCNGTTDTEAKEVNIPVMFGGYVYKDAETGIWGSYLEWEYVNLLKPNRIFSFMFINRRKDCCGRNNSFQSSAKNLCDYTLCLEYC